MSPGVSGGHNVSPGVSGGHSVSPGLSGVGGSLGRGAGGRGVAGDTSDLSWMVRKVADEVTWKDSARRGPKSSPSSIPEYIPVASLSVVAKWLRLESQ